MTVLSGPVVRLVVAACTLGQIQMLEPTDSLVLAMQLLQAHESFESISTRPLPVVLLSADGETTTADLTTNHLVSTPVV